MDECQLYSALFELKSPYKVSSISLDTEMIITPTDGGNTSAMGGQAAIQLLQV